MIGKVSNGLSSIYSNLSLMEIIIEKQFLELWSDQGLMAMIYGKCIAVI